MKNKLKISLWIISVLISISILFSVWLYFPSSKFDSQYWQKTNDFYMVFDMSKDLDKTTGLSHLQMLRISRKRSSMAEKLISDERLSGIGKTHVIELLGETHPWYTTKEYANTLQYAVSAERRAFHFYGESGIVHTLFIIWFDENHSVISTTIQ